MGRLALLTLPVLLVGIGVTLFLTSSAAEEPVTIVNSRNGLAVLEVADIAPGQSRSGEVTLTNTSARTGELTVTLTNVTDPSPNGPLSGRLLLTIEDLGSGQEWSSPWDDFTGQSLGEIEGGETRTFRVTATLPDTGDDNYLQASQTRGDLIWRASTSDPVPPPEPPPTDRPPPGTEPPAPAEPQVPERAPRMRLTLDGPPRRLLATGSLSVLVRCDEPCRVVAYAIVPGPGGRPMHTPPTATRTRRAHEPARVRVRIPRKPLIRIRRTLARGHRVSIRVVINARDRAGTARSITRRITLAPTRRR